MSATPADEESKVVEYQNGAPTENAYDDPLEWPNSRKWTITIVMALMTFTSTLCSSIWSATIVVTAKYFQASDTVMVLGVSLFVLGYALGPLLWGPLSELVGRQTPLFMGHFVFVILQIPIALGDSLTGLLICRFLAGASGASALVVTSAACSDFWAPVHRGVAMSIFSIAAYAGPCLGTFSQSWCAMLIQEGPVIGAYITTSHLGWRWTAWIIFIAGGVIGIVAVIVVPETYVPVLRQRAAGKQSVPLSAGNTLQEFGRKYLSRPISMLFREPLVCKSTASARPL